MERTNTITVFNTCTSLYEEIEVTQEVYNEFRRGEWRIKKNDDKHRANEIPFSELIGNDDDMLEFFSEFIDNRQSPESIIVEQTRIKELHSAMNMLSDLDQQLLQALFFDGLSEREYAELQGVSQPTIHLKKVRILKYLKRILP